MPDRAVAVATKLFPHFQQLRNYYDNVDIAVVAVTGVVPTVSIETSYRTKPRSVVVPVVATVEMVAAALQPQLTNLIMIGGRVLTAAAGPIASWICEY